MAERLAAAVSAAGYATVSGLARGIDTRAHAASVAQGTIAVLASGFEKPYPAENARLFAAIAEQGAAVTEMPLAHDPRGKDFPRRNRIISGLALGTVVVEAARQSGSLITARFALEQGRQVFAVPGSPLDPRAAGPNDLLHQGATIVRDAADILEALAPMVDADRPPATMAEDIAKARPTAGDDPIFLDESDVDPDAAGWLQADWEDGTVVGSVPGSVERLLALMSIVPADVDRLARDAGLTTREALAAVFELEAEGRLLRHSGNRVSLQP